MEDCNILEHRDGTIEVGFYDLYTMTKVSKTQQPLFSFLLLLSVTLMVYNNQRVSRKEIARYKRASATPLASPILTLFTTFKPTADKRRISENVLRNWARLKPRVQPILYTHETDETLVKLAESLGWLTVSVPRVTSFKVPYWKEMFYEAPRHSNTTFYGFCNGDLLFDDGLVDTLTALEQYLDYLEDVLVVGQRYNVDFKGQEVYKQSDVKALSRVGKLFEPYAIDYFFFAHNRFIWDKLADVIIARPSYDNYILMKAITNDFPVVDATNSILTVHLTGIDGNFAGFKNPGTKDFNIKAVEKFNTNLGFTNVSQYLTKINNDSRIELWQRKPQQIINLHPRTKRVRVMKRTSFIPKVL